MKQFFAMVIFLCCSAFVSAQTWGEWFNQKSTQIKYLLAQIAADQIYIDALEKGYAIAQDGLKAINDIKHGDFNLHNDYFSSLKNVHPAINNSDRVAGTITIQLQIKQDLGAARNQWITSGQFTNAELSFLQMISDNLLNESTSNIDELTTLLSPGQVSMTDDERIKRIEQVYKTMQDHLQFEKTFTGSALMLCYQRKAEQTDVLVSKKLNEVK